MSKQQYINFSNQQADLPLFMQSWWLDAVCGDMEWDAIVSLSDEEQVVGAWAFAKHKLRGMPALVLPPLSPFTGIWLDVDETLPVHKQNKRRQEILADLESQLPEVPIIELKLHWPLKDWMPFYWKDYHQETRYTFIFHDPDPEVILSNVSKSFRRNLRAAERQFSVRKSEDVGELQQLVRKVFEIRSNEMPFKDETIARAHAALTERGQCTIYCADTLEGDTVACILAVWDSNTTYYLMGGRSGSNIQSATNLLLMRAIEDAAGRGHAFDFEGSMIKGVHRFFQTFGATMQPYMYLYKYRGLAKVKQLR